MPAHPSDQTRNSGRKEARPLDVPSTPRGHYRSPSATGRSGNSCYSPPPPPCPRTRGLGDALDADAVLSDLNAGRSMLHGDLRLPPAAPCALKDDPWRDIDVDGYLGLPPLPGCRRLLPRPSWCGLGEHSRRDASVVAPVARRLTRGGGVSVPMRSGRGDGDCTCFSVANSGGSAFSAC